MSEYGLFFRIMELNEYSPSPTLLGDLKPLWMVLPCDVVWDVPGFTPQPPIRCAEAMVKCKMPRQAQGDQTETTETWEILMRK